MYSRRRHLSIARICSNKIMEFRFNPAVRDILTCVGNFFCWFFRLVIGTTITVGPNRFPLLFDTISTGSCAALFRTARRVKLCIVNISTSDLYFQNFHLRYVMPLQGRASLKNIYNPHLLSLLPAHLNSFILNVFLFVLDTPKYRKEVPDGQFYTDSTGIAPQLSF